MDWYEFYGLCAGFAIGRVVIDLVVLKSKDYAKMFNSMGDLIFGAFIVQAYITLL